jgi:uncharacterized protein (DUF2237 family)
MEKNILGTELQLCSTYPLTGFYRDGCCKTDKNDVGQHTVCAIMTEEFLSFSIERGNDLVTPRPEFNFSGLKQAPPILPESCSEHALRFVPKSTLMMYAREHYN